MVARRYGYFYLRVARKIPDDHWASLSFSHEATKTIRLVLTLGLCALMWLTQQSVSLTIYQLMKIAS